MSALADMDGPAALAPTLALNLTLSGGARHAWARVEVHRRRGWRVGWVRLRGWVGEEALARVECVMESLEAMGCHHALLDWSDVHHLDYRGVPVLLEALRRFEARAGSYVLCGLSRYLRDLIRVAGCEPCSWPSAAELLACDEGPWERTTGASAS